MSISMQWEFKEKKRCAHLVFEKENLPDIETIKKISGVITHATSGGDPVVLTNSIHKSNDRIFITKKQKVEWNKFRIAIEGAIRQTFPDTAFKNTEDTP